LLLVFMVVFLIPIVGASHFNDDEEYHIKLLAVSDAEEGESNKSIGITADLYLKTTPGTGNVFIETNTVTKLDTRISMKLAKETACEALDLTDVCDDHDFFYRMEANASIVGGPSAGAAAAALAIAAIEGSNLNQSVSITGTINSGGLIGKVGGIQKKIEAVSRSPTKKVLIPSEGRFVTSVDGENLETIDLEIYGKSLGVEVVEVSNIKDVLFHFTGKVYSNRKSNITIGNNYADTMKALADDLCSRSNDLSLFVGELLTKDDISRESAQRALQIAQNFTSDGIEEKEHANYYSAASLCFGANVRYSFLLILGENLSDDDLLVQINKTTDELDLFDEQIPEADSFSDLQIRGLVKERVSEARELLRLSFEAVNGSDIASEDGVFRLAFARERIGSARAWSEFLTTKNIGQEPVPRSVDYRVYSESLRNGCLARLQEAEEHIHYLDFYLPGSLNSKDELGPVYSYLRNSDYSSCVYRASISKAKVNTMLSALGVNKNITVTVDKKLEAAKESIVRQTEKGAFPIISYSYYEYAKTLRESDGASALLFAEYALELSNLDVYLKTTTGQPVVTKRIDGYDEGVLLGGLAIGFAAGFLAMFAVVSIRKSKNKGNKRIILSRPRVVKKTRRKSK
jgi:uncharacterized protein